MTKDNMNYGPTLIYPKNPGALKHIIFRSQEPNFWSDKLKDWTYNLRVATRYSVKEGANLARTLGGTLILERAAEAIAEPRIPIYQDSAQ